MHTMHVVTVEGILLVAEKYPVKIEKILSVGGRIFEHQIHIMLTVDFLVKRCAEFLPVRALGLGSGCGDIQLTYKLPVLSIEPYFDGAASSAALDTIN